MGRLERLKQKLQTGAPVLCTTMANLPWSGVIEKAAAFDFDLMMFDLEHGILSVESAEELLRVCRLCDLPSVVRVPDSVPNLISKCLDMGADGILLPRVERMEQVETAIRASKYAPLGRKGCGGFSNFRPEDRGSVEVYNENRMLFVQMESKEGLAVLPEILKTYGSLLSGVLIGPYDASIMVGTPLDIASAPMLDFIRQVFQLSREAGVSCGSFVDSADLLGRYRDLGANIYWTGTDISLLCEAYGNLTSCFRREFGEGRP